MLSNNFEIIHTTRINFLLLISMKLSYFQNLYTIVSNIFDNLYFKNSLEKDLFYNIHRIDEY